MSSFLCSDLSQLLSDASFVKEEVAKVVASGADEANTPIELWAQYFAVTHSNMEEFLRKPEIEEPELINAVERIIIDVESCIQGVEDPTYHLQTLLSNKHFTQEQIDKVVGSGIDKASTIIELWAQYYSSPHSNMEEFIEEREIEDPELINAVKRIILDVEDLLDTYNEYSDRYLN